MLNNNFSSVVGQENGIRSLELFKLPQSNYSILEIGKTAESSEPEYAVAYGYNNKTGEWSSAAYFPYFAFGKDSLEIAFRELAEKAERLTSYRPEEHNAEALKKSYQMEVISGKSPAPTFEPINKMLFGRNKIVVDTFELRECIGNQRFKKNLDVSMFDTSNVKSMDYMFFCMNDVENIKGLDTGDMSNVESAQGLFSECGKLKDIEIHKGNLPQGIKNKNMFKNCHSLNVDKNMSAPKRDVVKNAQVADKGLSTKQVTHNI